VQRPRFDIDWLRLYLLPAVAALVGLAVAVWLLDLAPPKHLTFAAGRPGSAYYALAERYQRILARDGIDLEIVETAGSVENAAALSRPDDPVDAGFLQGGVDPPPEAGIEALAATFLEPLWIFRGNPLADPSNPTSWPGLRVAAGEPGSGTRFAVDAVIDGLGLQGAGFDLRPVGGTDAAAALAAGDVDVALFVAPVDAPYLQPLLARGEFGPVAIRDPEALVRRLPVAQNASVPAAGFDYAARRPAEPLELVAMVGRLVAQPDLHPSLVDRLVMAAREVHAGRDLITAEDQFPTTTGVAMPENAQAANLLSGPTSPLHRFLPYWIVAQINSFALLLLPVVVILFPLFRIVPGLYQWRMRSRVYRHYLDLIDIERRALAADDAAALRRLDSRLDTIESDLVGIRLPVRFREYAYTMRLHLDVVRRRVAECLASLDEGRGSIPPPPPAPPTRSR
jgi:TRAP-type uncharacterized transport system substrate-binding protein